jgi:tRNA(Ile)-lysidine synthase
MRLIRGSGLRGLRGFLPKSKFRGLTVIRPLIELRKQDILDWLNAKKIHYCIDKTNLEEKFLRNKIRLKLLPLLSEFNPNITESLYNVARSISLDYDFIYNISYGHYESLKKGLTNQCVRLDLDGLKKLPEALLNNVLRIAIEEIKGDTRRIEIRHLYELCDLIYTRPSGSIVDLPSLIVKKEEKILSIQAY